MIVTVSRALKGESNVAPLRVIIPGGSVGKDYIAYNDGIYNFAVGQNVVLFLGTPRPVPYEIDGVMAWRVINRYAITGTTASISQWSYHDVPLQNLLDIIAQTTATPAAR